MGSLLHIPGGGGARAGPPVSPFDTETSALAERGARMRNIERALKLGPRTLEALVEQTKINPVWLRSDLRYLVLQGDAVYLGQDVWSATRP